jgi:hypothetical protein
MYISKSYNLSSIYLLLSVLFLFTLFLPSTFAQADTTTLSQNETVLKIEELQKLVEKYQNMQLAITQPATTSTLTTKLAGTSIGIWNKNTINFTLYFDVIAKDLDVYIPILSESYGLFSVLNSKKENATGSFTSEFSTQAEKVVGSRGHEYYKVAKGTKMRFVAKVVYRPYFSDDTYNAVLNQLPFTNSIDGMVESRNVNYSTYPVMWRASGY